MICSSVNLLFLMSVILLMSGLLATSAWYGRKGAGQFPRCVQVTPRCVAWAESAVLQWVQDRIGAALAPTTAEKAGVE
ncbi:helix-turn-helix transcriptional regulator [Roseateles sp. P5_E4]